MIMEFPKFLLQIQWDYYYDMVLHFNQPDGISLKMIAPEISNASGIPSFEQQEHFVVMLNNRAGLLPPRLPRTRTCDFHRIRLTHSFTHCWAVTQSRFFSPPCVAFAIRIRIRLTVDLVLSQSMEFHCWARSLSVCFSQICVVE